MILYFDTFITDVPLYPHLKQQQNPVRNASPAYRMPKKIDIAKYSLASYAVYPWDHVLIRYELEDPAGYSEFDAFIKSLFPQALIMHQRSDSQTDYQESVRIMDTWKDNWIFFAPNNDHPLLISHHADILYIQELLKLAGKWEKSYEFVSIVYSHFSEYIGCLNPQSADYYVFGRMGVLLENNALAITHYRRGGDSHAIHIVNKKLFRHWFTSTQEGDKKIVRPDQVSGLKIDKQVVIVPKRQLCAHFDMYYHARETTHAIWQELIPPLLIPEGFFSNQVRIAYGFYQSLPGFLNLNPTAKEYSFETAQGTDLKWALDDIPLFWHGHIQEIKINPKLDWQKMERGRLNQQAILLNPWSMASQGWNLRALWFHFKLSSSRLHAILNKLGIYGSLKAVSRRIDQLMHFD